MTNDSIDNIRLDLNRMSVKAAIYVREGDTKTRTLHCTLADHGSVVDLSDAVIAEILISRADGNEGDNSVVIYGNELQYTWRTSDLSAVGENICQFMVTFSDGSVVTSPKFSLFVYKKTISQSVQKSFNEYTALTQQVVLAKGYAESASESAAETNTDKEEVAEILSQANDIRDEIVERETAATEAATEAATSEENAKESETNAAESEAKAAESADASESNAELTAKDVASCAESVESAKGYSEKAAEYDETYKSYVNLTKGYSDSASDSATNASTSEGNASTSEANAATSEGAAHGWYQKTKDLYDDIGGGTLTLGITHTTAAYGDEGAASYAHSQITAGNPHGTTYSDVGADASGAAASMYQQSTGYTDQKIADLINGAPETLDTLKEIADAMASSAEVVEALEKAIGEKANDTEFQAHQDNTTVHITADERTKWDANITNLNTHTANTDIHITADERTKWNKLVTELAELKGMIGYPYTPTTEGE